MTRLTGTFRYFIETFGCQMNQRDSETIEGLLLAKGFFPADTVDEADIVVVNTCAVRESAETKVWSRIGEIAAMSRNSEPRVIVLAGCMAQIPENIDRIKKRAPYVKVVTGPGNIHCIPDLVEEALRLPSSRLLTAVSPSRTEAHKKESTQVLPENLPRKRSEGPGAYVTIMYGCDNFCSYCVVPFVRGPQVSREPQNIISEVKQLVESGCSEITLLGQNVNAYGFDLDHDYGFAELLQDLDTIPDLARIRYFTSHPKDFSKEMVKTISQSQHICEHFHLPVQSGSNRMLRLMNRRYTIQDYCDLVDLIREEVSNPAITTDIIVGFPGETDQDFQETLSLVEKIRFDGAFTFIYSARSNTPAARMKNQISREIKSRRLQELVALQNEITRSINSTLLGSTQEVLIEGFDKKHTEYSRGRARSNKLVVCTTPGPKPGDMVNVRIEETGTWYLKGPLVDAEQGRFDSA
ncbi:MAG: tRNA (N6-isopentenyl adenosine(37)-C2)-methylthiotransferase MiaB [Firmicutes bacterium]|nr:tRNA (N6-isopentenyl adenosine(37)-C2)-methylthiotransferase MiaB [Candidatus Fermentithermobacillaceae bacterium]